MIFIATIAVPIIAILCLAGIARKNVIFNFEKKVYLTFLSAFTFWASIPLLPGILYKDGYENVLSYFLALSIGISFATLAEIYKHPKKPGEVLKSLGISAVLYLVACGWLIHMMFTRKTMTAAWSALYIFIIAGIIIRGLVRLYREKARFIIDQQKKIRYAFFLWSGIATGLHITLCILAPLDYALIKAILGIAVVGFITYAVVREFSLNLETLLKRTVLYTILYSTVVGIFVVVISLISHVLFYGSGLPEQRAILISLFTLLIVTSIIKPLDKFLSELTDKYLLQKKYEYQNLLKEAAKGMTQITDINHLIKIITHFIALRLRVTHVGIMFKERDNFVLRESRGELKKSVGFKIPADSTLVKWLEEKNDILTIDELNAWINVPNQSVFKPILKESLLDIKKQLEGLHSVVCIPSFGRQRLLGFMILGEKLSGEAYTKEDKALLSALAHEASVAIENALLYDELLKQLKEIKSLYEREHQMFIQTAIAFANAIDAKDAYTHGHTERVTTYSVAIAKELINSVEARNIPNFIDTIHFAALLHDVGKIGIPDKILNKKGKLNKKEVDLMKMHPIIGASILYPIKGLNFVAGAVKHHHEYYNGKGYPDNLKTKDIPFVSRIIAIADAFDAMTTDRPYRPKMEEQQALHELLKNSGNQFDPLIAEAFVEVYNKRKIPRDYNA